MTTNIVSAFFAIMLLFFSFLFVIFIDLNALLPVSWRVWTDRIVLGLPLRLMHL